MSLGDILIFITGVGEVPPMGFDRPLKIEFVVASDYQAHQLVHSLSDYQEK